VHAATAHLRCLRALMMIEYPAMNPGYRKRTIILLIVLLLVRFWYGQTFELSGREAYLWLEGHGVNLSPGYWERGPFVPFLVRVGTTFFGDTELGVRWLAAVIACLTGFTLFFLARHWFNARGAFWTVVLFVVVPMFAWKLSFMTEATAAIGLMALAMLGFSRGIEEDKLGWWLVGGAACGLGMLISIGDAWWLAGLLLYFLVEPVRRPRLREPLLWMTLIFSTLFLAPLVWWWHGPQVADIRHSRLFSDWPLSHPFSLGDGFHFIALEAFYLCPFFALALVVLLARVGREVWSDPRIGLLVCLALPGLVWENFAAFFHAANFELVPALFLPLLIPAGCCMDRLAANERRSRALWGAVLILAAVQSIAGLNPFYLRHDDGGSWRWHRLTSGENVTSFNTGKRQISWRNLADQMSQMQREVGANLIITDTPGAASALSFYLPHNPTIYVEDGPDVVTQFDFWPHYTDAASPNDSALFITRSNDANPPADLVKNFASVTPLPDMPLPDFDKSWNLWNCQRFVGESQPAGAAESSPLRESDSLPK
jgi:Dolichyl-phosphate-mannose-protein mannosyltransferase